jgi:hypothetical protein
MRYPDYVRLPDAERERHRRRHRATDPRPTERGVLPGDVGGAQNWRSVGGTRASRVSAAYGTSGASAAYDTSSSVGAVEKEREGATVAVRERTVSPCR